MKDGTKVWPLKRIPKPGLEKDMVRILQNEKHFDLAYQAWEVLEESYGYDSNRLRDLVSPPRGPRTL